MSSTTSQRGLLFASSFHAPAPALLVDFLERDTALLHERDRDRPVVEGRPECHRALCGIELPPGLVGLLVHALYQLVDLVDDLPEPDLHLHLVDLELVDEPVDLVDEEDGADPLLEGLPQHRLGLGHGALDGIHEHDRTVDSPHGPGHVTAEVHVSRGVDHVDQVFLPLVLVDHGDVACVDRDPAGLLLLVGVHEELLASEFL